MDHVLVRYGEIGSKSDSVRGQMVKLLRQRVEDRLEYENIDYEKVSTGRGRIHVETSEPETASKLLSEVPGVSSTSPTIQTVSKIEKMKEAVKELQIGESFGVNTSRAGEHKFDSREVNREIGSFVEDLTGSQVDLDSPVTWIEIDVRYEDCYVFTERFEGPGGFPISSDNTMVALISGGIDSPVAAYEIMKKGVDIIPVYFYNKPFSAEDHLLRFENVIEKLERFHPSKNWDYYVVDMEKINNKLLEVEKGRMVLQRVAMFKIAEKIVEKEGESGIVTGESLNQKSSQTFSNISVTSDSIDSTVHRPLLTWNKPDITEKARELDTFEESKIDSACRTISPESPSTSSDREKIEDLWSQLNMEELVEESFTESSKNRLS